MACKKPEGFFEGLVHDATLYSAVQASKDSNGKPDPYKACLLYTSDAADD